MAPAGKSRPLAWVLGPSAVAVGLLAQLVAAVRIGLLPFDRSFAAGADGEWLTLLATITGLAAITSALGGLVTSGLLDAGHATRLGAVALAAGAGLASLPLLRGLADDSRDVQLAIGGPRVSVTIALCTGLALGALTAALVRASDWPAVAAGLAATTVGLWAVAAVSTSIAVTTPPLGLPEDLFQTLNLSRLGGWFPLPPVLWAVIGAVSALVARCFVTRRSTVVLGGTIGAVLVCLSYFTARPNESDWDQQSVHSLAIGLTIMLVGGALIGSFLVSRLSMPQLAERSERPRRP